MGTLKISDIFPWDKAKYIKGVYNTERTDHPGGHMTMNDPRDMLLGRRGARVAATQAS